MKLFRDYPQLKRKRKNGVIKHLVSGIQFQSFKVYVNLCRTGKGME